jgi:hypothetical protein
LVIDSDYEFRWNRVMRSVLVVLTALLLGACFDSRWTTDASSQRVAAKRLTPRLGTSEKERLPRARDIRSFRVRAWANASYAAEGGDWRRRFQLVLDDANEVLTREARAKLVLAEAAHWPGASATAELETWLGELEARDPGEGVDWVIGLVGSTPKLEMSFHELGVGRMLGKHIVLRNIHDANEWAAIEQSFSSLSEDERRALATSRRRHKAAAVLLHELAHTLGAPHVSQEQTLLSRVYDIKATGFAAPTLRLLRTSLAHRGVAEGERDERGFAQAVLAELMREDASWVAEERERLAHTLRRVLEPEPARVPEAPSRRESAKPARVQAPAALSGEHAAVFERASRELEAGRAAEAWDSAKTLFSAYPDDYQVQDLRCRIATRRGLDYREVKSECQRMMELTPGVPGWK